MATRTRTLQQLIVRLDPKFRTEVQRMAGRHDVSANRLATVALIRFMSQSRGQIAAQLTKEGR